MFLTTPLILGVLLIGTTNIDVGSSGEATAYNIGQKLVSQSNPTTLHLTYEKEGWVMYTNSTDGGTSWSTPEPLAKGKYPCIGLDYHNYQWLAYLGNDSIFCLIRNSQGYWDRVLIFGGNQNQKSGSPSLVVSPSIANDSVPFGFVVFPVYSLSANRSSIKYAKFNRNRVVMGDIDAADGFVDSLGCIAVTQGDILHLCWQKGDEVFYCEATVLPDCWDAIFWSLPYNLSNTPNHSSKHPSIEQFGDSIYVTWVEDNTTVKVAVKPIIASNEYWSYRNPLQSDRVKDFPVMRTNQIVAWQEQNGENKWEIYADIRGDTINISQSTFTNSQFCHIVKPDGRGEPMPPDPDGRGEPMPPDPDFLWSEEIEPGGNYRICFLHCETENNGGQSQRIANRNSQPILYQNEPNPFNLNTTISYFLPKECGVSLKIYDGTGRLVKKFVHKQKAGLNQQNWDGKDNIGLKVPNGVYFYELEALNCRVVEKMTISR